MLLILLLEIAVVYAGSFPLVTTPNGDVQGTYSKSYKGRIYSQFLGVPYARPPVGSLRFKEPQPVQKWSGVWNANFSTYCIQVNHFPDPEGGNLIGQEDCLYLNVYVPGDNPHERELLDVVVHVHGGAFNFGSGNAYAGPKFLMDIDVILVTMNYRLGPFGFLSTEDEVVPGNDGMKDQVESLKWIRNNIKYFGGDPASVTLTGLSAGGASVHYHYLSPLSEGLFNKGISLSGSALCPWSFQERALEKTRQLGAAVGCFQKHNAELVDCLRQRPAEQIVNGVRAFRPWLYNPFSPFGVVTEKGGSKPFLSEHPYEIIAKGEAQDLPWLASVTSDEGLYPAADYVLKDNYLVDLEKRWLELAASILDFNYTLPSEVHASVAEKAKNFYLDGKKISKETYGGLVQMIGDRHFVVPVEKAARLQASVAKAPVYYYYFSYNAEEVSTFAVYYTNSEERRGVCHGDDVTFVMSKPFKDVIKMSVRDEAVKDVLLGVWETFIKTGVPKINNTEWTPVQNSTSGDLPYLHIKSPEYIQMEIGKDMGHAAFWNTIPFEENEILLSKH